MNIVLHYRRNPLAHLVAGIVLVILLIHLVAGTLRAQAPAPRPLGELLNPDGSLRKGASAAQGIDPRGWTMRTRPDGTPYFVHQESASSVPDVPGDENWDSNFGSFTMDGNIYAMAVISGQVYVGGSFDNIGTVEAHRLARWDGTTWQAVGGGIDGYVYAMAVDGGNLYVGGQFTHVGTVSAANIAVWNHVGGGWSALDAGVTAEAYAYVSAIAVGSAEVFVGGSFTSAGHIQASNIARWNKSARQWSALGVAGAEGTNGDVLALKTSGNNLWVGGNYTRAGGATMLNASRWDIATSKWIALAGGVNGYVNAIGIARYGVYFGGGFDSSGSTYLSNFARWDTKWRGAGAYGYVRDILWVDPLVYVTGAFRHVSRDESAFNVLDNYVGAYGHDTISSSLDDILHGYIPTWRPFGNRILNGMDGYTNAVAIEGTNVYFGGSFRVAGGLIQGRVAVWDSLAHRWRAFGVAITGPVQAIAVNGNDVYVSGTFEPNVGNSISTIVKWDGNAWSYVETNITGTVSAMALARGELYVGGRFKRIQGVWCHNIAHLNLVSKTWAPLDTGLRNLDTNDIPFVGAIASDGDNIYAGGYFTLARDLVVNNVARWNIPEQKWYAMRNGVSGLVRTIAVDAGGTPYIGGALAVPGDTSTFNVARWDGDRWRIVGGGLWGSVATLVFKGGDLYAGGNFVAVGAGRDSSIKYIARWDGSQWNAIGRRIDGNVATLVNSITFEGNDLYAAGYFDSIDGDTVNNIARWDGSRWWALGSGTDDAVFAIAPVGKSIFAGGQFLLAGQKPSLYFGRWKIQTASAPQAADEPGAMLEQNSPNPFAGQTAIAFTTERPGHVTLKVFDVEGSEVATLVEGYRPAGSHAVVWHAADVPPGAYYYRLQCGTQVETRKLMVVR